MRYEIDYDNIQIDALIHFIFYNNIWRFKRNELKGT